MYKRSNHLEVIRYSNLDFLKYINSRKFTFAYLFLLGERAISWKSAQESVTTLSNMEAEFVAYFKATIHAL